MQRVRNRALAFVALVGCGRVDFVDRASTIEVDAGADSATPTGITHVTGVNGADLTGNLVPFSLPPFDLVAGNTVLVMVGTYTDATGPTVSDSAGNTYTPIVQQFNGSAGGENYSYMYIASDVNGDPADVVSITPTNYPVVVADQYSGLSGVVDATTTGIGGTGAAPVSMITTTPFNTTHANDLVYAAMSIDIVTEDVTGATLPMKLRTVPPLLGGMTQGLGSADYVATGPLSSFAITMTGQTNGGTGHNDCVILAAAIEGR